MQQKEPTLITTTRMSQAEFEERLRKLVLTRHEVGKVDFKVTLAKKLPAETYDFELRNWKEIEDGDDTPTSMYKPQRCVWAIELTWEAAIPGHTPIAHLDLDSGLATSFAGQMTKEDYDRMTGCCDVCHTHRGRRHQFLIERDEDGKRLVVGGSCAKKFCGVDLYRIAQKLDLLNSRLQKACEMDEVEFFGGRDRYPVEVTLFLAATEYCLANWGWLSRSQSYDRSTATEAGNIAFTALWPKGNPKYWPVTPEDLQKITVWGKALDLTPYLEFARAENERRWSDLTQSWVNVLETGRCNGEAFGRLAYLPVAMGKAKIKARQQANQPKRTAYKPQGDPDKMHNLPGEWTVLSMKEGETEWGCYIGITAQDQDGQTVWFKGTNGTRGKVKIGETVKLRAKVKAVKDTITFLSHAKVVS